MSCKVENAFSQELYGLIKHRLDAQASPREGGGVMKPVYLRVCIAVVLSATGLIMARFESWKEDNEVNSCASNQESSSSPSRNNDGEEEENEEK
ncbi:hypothetical protein F2Q68_00001494 [Brassica cretica]|uniref:Uncharacterized protein n=1 Tax=Brassica cretica TaxID=69181 RepID=A0A8S9J508_BRACR|nr:hypothetical protein F2Q68_00001494 [Brassica cretica]